MAASYITCIYEKIDVKEMNSSIKNCMGVVASKSENPQGKDVFLLQLGVHISESAVNNNRDCTHWGS
eukprot:scaffold234101_cov19-Prasinocladus_malaysianus.AAC.1